MLLTAQKEIAAFLRDDWKTEIWKINLSLKTGAERVCKPEHVMIRATSTWKLWKLTLRVPLKVGLNENCMFIV